MSVARLPSYTETLEDRLIEAEWLCEKLADEVCSLRSQVQQALRLSEKPRRAKAMPTSVLCDDATARVQRVAQIQPTLELGDGTRLVVLHMRLTRADGRTVSLTPIETLLVATLGQAPGLALDFARLALQVWGLPNTSVVRTRRAHLSRLGAKAARVGIAVRPLRGVGVALDVLP